MADSTPVGRRRRREDSSNDDVDTKEGTPLKKIKIEPNTPSEANPNAMEAVQDKNKAMEFDLKEKNRRITFLTQKCQRLFRSRAIMEASLQATRKNHLQLAKDLKSLLKDTDSSKDASWQQVLDASDPFTKLQLNKDIVKLVLPEWFICISRGDEDVKLPDVQEEDKIPALKEVEATIEKELKKEAEVLKEILQQVLVSIGKNADVDAKKILEEKRAAVAQVLQLQQKLEASQKQIKEIQEDLELTEVERHQALRDLHRLSRYMEEHNIKAEETAAAEEDAQKQKVQAAEEEKSNESEVYQKTQEELRLISGEAAQEIAKLRQDNQIFSSKLASERQLVASLKLQIEQLKASEVAWKKEEADLKHEMEANTSKWKQEKAHLDEQLNKIRHKTKDLEVHLHEKWKKKFTKIQADNTKTKTQFDEIQIRNAQLKEKLSTYSAFRDNVIDLKTQHTSLTREVNYLRTQLEREQNKTVRLEAMKEAQKSIPSDLHNKDKSELVKLVHTLQLQMEELKKTQNDMTEENNALISEVEGISKEMENVRHSRKKLTAQVDEKRNACKKLQSALSKEEQAKAHCFEELAAVRLQASNLNAVHQQQTATLEGLREVLETKEKAFEELKTFVTNIQAEKEEIETEKRKIVREAEIAKQSYDISAEEARRQQDLLREEREKNSCEKCEQYKKKEEKYEKMLKARPSSSSGNNGNSGGLSELERLELNDLQKLVKCSVCMDGQKNVIISKCMHMFCKDCMDNNLKARNRKCPTCKKMFGQDDVKNVWWT